MRLDVLIVFFVFVSSMMIVSCSQQQVSFSKNVKPIFDANCLRCHNGTGEGSLKSGFVVSNYDTIMKGTKHGPVVIAGSSVSSTLYRLVSQAADEKIQMPPHHHSSLAAGRGKPLSDKEVETIKEWIDEGAKDN